MPALYVRVCLRSRFLCWRKIYAALRIFLLKAARRPADKLMGAVTFRAALWGRAKTSPHQRRHRSTW